jgi:hypothetical protein
LHREELLELERREVAPVHQQVAQPSLAPFLELLGRRLVELIRRDQLVMQGDPPEEDVVFR